MQPHDHVRSHRPLDGVEVSAHERADVRDEPSLTLRPAGGLGPGVHARGIGTGSGPVEPEGIPDRAVLKPKEGVPI